MENTGKSTGIHGTRKRAFAHSSQVNYVIIKYKLD